MYIDVRNQTIHLYNKIDFETPRNFKIYDHGIYKYDMKGCVTFLWIMEMKIRKNEQVPFGYFVTEPARDKYDIVDQHFIYRYPIPGQINRNLEVVNIARKVLNHFVPETYNDVIPENDLHPNIFQNMYNQAYVLYRDTTYSAMYIDERKQEVHTYNYAINIKTPMEIYDYDVFKSDIAGCVTFLWIMHMKIEIKVRLEIPFNYFTSDQAVGEYNIIRKYINTKYPDMLFPFVSRITSPRTLRPVHRAKAWRNLKLESSLSIKHAKSDRYEHKRAFEKYEQELKEFRKKFEEYNHKINDYDNKKERRREKEKRREKRREKERRREERRQEKERRREERERERREREKERQQKRRRSLQDDSLQNFKSPQDDESLYYSLQDDDSLHNDE